MPTYNQIAKSYNELHKDEQLKKLAIIKQYLKPNPDDLLLDVGCGTGISSDWPCRVIGIDPSNELLKQNPYENRLGSAEDMPFKDNMFDYIISLTAIHNFKNIKEAFGEIIRVSKPNTKYAFSILRKAKRFNQIEKLIRSLFNVKETIEEDKDIIFIAENR